MRAGLLVLAVAGGLLITAAPAGAHVPSGPLMTLLGPQPWPGGLPVGGLSGNRVAAQAQASGRATPTAYGDCGPDALPETGFQGEVPRADQVGGRSKLGYRCNVRPVGENDIKQRGENFQLAWYRECAYVGLIGSRENNDPAPPPHDRLEGFAVLDASDVRRPELVQIVRSAIGRGHHEGVTVNERRGLLVMTIGDPFGARFIEIYDVSDDCRAPVFKGRYDAGRPIFHGLKVADDGRTIYAAEWPGLIGAGRVLTVIDISDPAHPSLITSWDPAQEHRPRRYGIHDLALSPDGTRAYLGAVAPSSIPGVFGVGSPSKVEGPSMVILDTTDVQQRRPDPDLKAISEIELENFGHTVQPARIGGRPYLFVSGETPFGGGRNCPWSWGHVVDISDEQRPREISQIKLEVNERERCDDLRADNGEVYSVHYSGVDDERDTTRVFYTYYTGGLRVFDVRDPARPTEVGYYHTPPEPSVVLPPLGPGLGDFRRPTWDAAPSVVRYRPQTGEVWFATYAGGLRIVELTGVARPRGCLSRRSPIGPRNIGRVRLGYSRRRLLRLSVSPARRTRRTYRYCVKGGSGRVAAVFSRRGRVQAVTTTARGHGNRRVRVGSTSRRFARAFPSRRRVARGIYRAGRRSTRIFGLRRGKVRYIAVVPRRLIQRPRTLRRYLRLAGL